MNYIIYIQHFSQLKQKYSTKKINVIMFEILCVRLEVYNLIRKVCIGDYNSTPLLAYPAMPMASDRRYERLEIFFGKPDIGSMWRHLPVSVC